MFSYYWSTYRKQIIIVGSALMVVIIGIVVTIILLSRGNSAEVEEILPPAPTEAPWAGEGSPVDLVEETPTPLGPTHDPVDPLDTFNGRPYDSEDPESMTTVEEQEWLLTLDEETRIIYENFMIMADYSFVTMSSYEGVYVRNRINNIVRVILVTITDDVTRVELSVSSDSAPFLVNSWIGVEVDGVRYPMMGLVRHGLSQTFPRGERVVIDLYRRLGNGQEP
jgi:hypothetical protein